MKRFRTYLMAYFSLAIAGLLIFLASQPTLIFSAPSASTKVNEAWQRAQDVGIYEYDTDIVQTTWPTERLENVGLSSKQERVYLAGQINRHEDFMQMAMWSDSGGVENGQGAIELKVEDGKALGRVGQGEWEEVDDATNFLTPENDSLSYLVAAKNVREMGQETRAGVTFTRYTFDVDGPTFAQYMREQMEEGLRRKGELPARMNLSLADQYVAMTATGELWVDADGLPLRQMMQMQFPAARGAMEWYEAQITTDFSNWGPDVEGAAFLGLPRLLRQHDWQQTGFSLGLMAGLMGLVALMVLHRESKVVYRAFVTATIVAMVVGPLMNSHQVYAFSERQQARVAQHEQAQERQETLLEAEAKLNENQFDPTVSPLAQAQRQISVEAPQPSNPPTFLGSPLTSQPDLDAATRARAAASSADSDGDGLSDEIELNELGTNPKHIDTDGDFISDKREVEGFKDASNRQWYLNPLAPDTNGDSQVDMQECADLIDVEAQADGSFKLVTPTGSRCQDTDGDGTPDIFDFDDDNDGVSDRVDSAPTTVLAGGKNASGALTGFISNTLNFKLDQFEKDKPMLVDIQLRPTNAKHLWYTRNVLDWPANDKEGQVRRVFTDTFGASGKDANGDMRLLPMLEIEIPFQAGHYGNLPVKSGYSGGITASTPLTNWLDQSKIDSYGMSVRKKDDKGTLLVHVPLNVVREQADDSPVALGGRIYYQPHSSSFGKTHKMRLVWVIRAKVDSCKPPANTDYDTYCGKPPQNWRTSEQVIHSYEDEWYVTGLSVREEHGIDVAAVFENPSHAGGNAHYDNYLWHFFDGLQRSFLAGRKGSDGKRDFTFSEIKRRFDKDSNSSVSNTQRWNIPAQALQVKNYHFKEEGETTTIPMTHTKQILTTHFPTASVGKTVNLLFAREEMSRMAFLGSNTPTAPAKNKGTISANSLTLSFAATQKEVLTGMIWAPFKHKGSGTWEPYAIEEYWSKLDRDFQQALSSESDATARAGRVLLAKSYYISLLSGSTNTIVKRGARLITIGTPATDAQLAAQNPNLALMTITNRLLTSVVNSYIGRITSLNPALSLDLSIPARQKEILQAIGHLNQSGNQQNGLGSHHQALRQLANQVAAANGGVTTDGLLDLSALTAMGAQAEAKANGLPDWAAYSWAAGKVSSVMYTAYVYHGARTMGKQIGAFVTTYKMNLAASSMAKWTIVIGIGTAIGMFAYEWATNGWTVGSLAFNQGLALMASGIITAVIMAAIAAIFPAGTILVVLIALTDAILITLCQTGNLSGDYICSGIAAAFTKVVSLLLYDYTPLADLQVEGRMRPTNFKQTLDKVTRGMSVGNKIRLTADVITDLYMNSPTALGYTYWHQFSDSNLRESTFKYQFQEKTQDIHDSLSKNQTSWTHLSDGDKRGTARQSVSVELPFKQAGLNVKTDFYLAEGYKMEAQECFIVYYPPAIVVPVCYLKDKEDTVHLDLGQNFKFDIFPATLDKFYELRSSESNGFALAWDKGFPTLMDADGDGLRSKAKGGNDPDDSAGDSDADGLSDFWEIKNGYDASNADGDNDGLNDYWERFHSTNPRQADTDNDGLLDGEEVFHQNLRTNAWEGGWEIVYAFGTGNTPKKTLVTSDPLNPDTDGDGILDKLEKVYGFHPRLPSKLNVLSIQSQVHNPNATLPNLVAPGQTIVYTATIDNHLRDRYALGLLELDFPVAVQNSSVAAKTYQLVPNAQTTIKGEVTVRADIAASQQVTLTNRAGANIANLRGEAEGRVLWLHLNENRGATTFTDKSLLAHHATCSGSNCPTAGQAGYVGQALTFDGSNDYVTIPYHKDFDFNTTGFTVMTWVKTSSWTAEPVIIANKDWGSGNNKGFVLAAKSDGSKWKFNIGDGNGSNRIDVDGKVINDNQWHHLAVTVQRVGTTTTVTAYHDGVQVAQSSKEQSDINISQPIGIGRDAIGSYNHYFRGSIDEVEIYPRAFNPFEMAERFKEPLFHAKFDGNLNDSSIYSNIIQNPGESNRHPAINSSGGVVGGYANFNGKTHLYIDPTNHFNLNLSKGRGEFTLATWVKPSAGNKTLWRGVLGWSYSSGAYPTLSVKDRKIRVGFNNGSGLCQTESRNNVLTEGQWSHVVAAFDTSTSPNTFRLYINGQQVPNTTPTACGSVIPPSVSGFSIGRHTADAQLHIERLYVTDEDDGSGNAEVKLHLNDKTNDYIWYHDDVDAWNSYSINKYRTIFDGRQFFILCENDGSWSQTCGGADDIMIYPNQATFSNLQPGSHSYRYGPGINRSEDGSGTLYWSVTNHNYNGGVDEARVYGYAMSLEEVEDLYNGTLRALELRFDEAPRRTKFQDSSGNKLTATCSGNSCPDSGIPGRSNQTLRFDGVDDSVTVSNLNGPQGSYTLAAWVKFTGSDTSGYNTIMEFGNDAPWFGMYNGKLHLHGGASGGSVPTNKWVHVAATWDGTKTRLYIDGTETVNSSSAARTGGQGLGIGKHTGDKAWKGLIDQVTVIRKALSAAEVQALMQEVPVLNLHLDEKLGVTTFIDDSPNANHATCTGSACPKAGSKGWMREGLVFDGVDDLITVPDSNALDLNRFTIGLWVKPIHLKDRGVHLIEKLNRNLKTNYSLSLRSDKKVVFSVSDSTCTLAGGMAEISNKSLIENQWNHLMMTYNGQKVVLYINGTPDKEKPFTGNLCHNNEPLMIGSYPILRPFAGQMDEIVIYGQGLSRRAVKALYDYQVAWFDSTVSHNITVDADKPTVALALDVTHIAKKDIVIAIQASDKSSRVEKVEYNINGGAWQNASRDHDAWTFTYSPAAEGAQTINVRATDSVGHQKTSSKSVTVDNTAPTITLDPSYTSGTSRTDKTVQLHGTVNDTSSGIRDLYVELLDHTGKSVSAPRLATITGSAWRVTHTFAFPPTGQYTVRLVATDKVGNTKNNVVGPTSRQQSSGLQFDNQAPQADITSTGTHTATISGSASLPTIAGTISEVPTPNNPLLHYHFEETSAATTFRDGSGNFHHGTCSGSACPTAGSGGKYGKALSFDGTQDYITLPRHRHFDFDKSHFTISLWVKSSGWSGDPAIISNKNWGSGSQKGFVIAGQGGGAWKFNLGDGSSTRLDTAGGTINDNQWHHLAVSVALSGTHKVIATLYQDGTQVGQGSKSLTNNINTTYPINIAQDGTGSYGYYFPGMIDEVAIYGRALTGEEIYALANPTSSGVAQAQINWRHAKDRGLDDGLQLDMPFEEPTGSTLFGDISTNRLSASCTTCPTSGTSGQFGKALQFDGSDDYLTIGNPAQLPSDRDMTWAAWVKTSADGTLIAKTAATGNWAQGGKTLFIRSGSPAFDVGWVGVLQSSAPINDNQWHHVALTVDFEQAGTNDKATLYVDGGEVASKQDWNVNSFSEANLALKIGHTADNFLSFFNGLMDEVRIYDRALSGDEITALHKQTWQFVTLSNPNTPFSTWSYQLPAGIEGPHQIHLRTVDGKGNTTMKSNLWTGEVDTQAPRVTLNVQNLGSRFRYTTQATDYNQSELGFNSPCGVGTISSRQYVTDAWYTALFGSTKGSDKKIYRLNASCESAATTLNEVGTLGGLGNTQKVAVAGNYAYVVSNQSGLRIVDISTPNSPREVGSYVDSSSKAKGVAVAGNYAYVAYHHIGLVVVDVSTPSSPRQVGVYNTPDWALDVTVAGNYAYVADDKSGLQIIDISNPVAPSLASAIDTPGRAQDVTVSGNYAYVADWDRGLQVIDIENPAAATLAGAIDTPGAALGVAVAGNYAYLAANNQGLQVIDISNPSSPTLITTLGDLTSPHDVEIAGDLAYVAGYSDGLYLVNISNPNSPSHIGGTGTPGYTRGVALAGTHAYVAADNGGLRIISLTSSTPQAIACDAFNNCTTTSLTSHQRSLVEEGVAPLNAALNVALEAPLVIENNAPLTLTGLASADNFLREFTISVDDNTIYSQNWENGIISDTIAEAAWTAEGEGQHIVAISASDWLTNTATYTQPLTLDTQPPTITLESRTFTGNEYDEAHVVELYGSAIDGGGIEQVEVEIEGIGSLSQVELQPNNWSALWYLDADNPPDGVNYTVNITATDVANRHSAISEQILIDATPPTPITPTLSYDRPSFLRSPTPLPIIGEGSQATQVITAGTTIDDVLNPILTVEWTESSDNSGLSSTLVEWVDMDSGEVLASEEVTEPRRATFTAPEALKLGVRISSRDIYGNQTTDTIQPIYIDYGHTPVYVSWDEQAEPYRGWTENACNLVGVDYRIDDNHSTLAALQETQQFYTSWDTNGLRLAWTGADWQQEGDLFIYLDSKEGGSVRAYNPYTDTQETIVLLPLRPTLEDEERPDGEEPPDGEAEGDTVTQMGADYLIWVEEDGNIAATLMRWNEETQEWVAVEDEWLYAFDADIKATDIYLPFELLGLENPEKPEASSLAIVALATEEDALRIWSTMPRSNNINSNLVGDFLPDGLQILMLNKEFSWSALTEGVCPVNTLTTDNIEFSITLEPAGMAYTMLEDNLIEAQADIFESLTDWAELETELCDLDPEDPFCEREMDETIDFDAEEGLEAFMDVKHPLLGNQQAVTVTVRILNRGLSPATNLALDATTWGPIILAEGTLEIDEEGQFYSYQQAIGNLAAGEERIITLRGLIDFSFDPQNNEGWATIDGTLTEERPNLEDMPIEWFYVDYELDQNAPEDIELSAPELLAAGENRLQGTLFDDSAVPTLMLEVEGLESTTCHDEEANDQEWSCPVDIGPANEGDTVKIRVKATDEHDHESEWSDWHDFTVDNTPPTITLDNDSQSTISDGLLGPEELIISGVLTDNRLVSQVDVCQTIDGAEACQSATVLIDGDTISDTTFIYQDEPPTPLTIDANAVCEGDAQLVRTFAVSDSFTIAEVEVGLNLQHPFRYDIEAYLTSPAGTQITLISQSEGENFDLLLSDSASMPLEDDEEDEHDTAAPYYDYERHPFEDLAEFEGQNAAGEWQLTICDNYPAEDDGAYNHSRLILSAAREQENTQATWQYQLASQDYQEGSPQALAIVGVDSVGNRSQPYELTFTVDNTPPVISATVPSSLSLLSSELSLSGEATDENGILSLQLNIQTPNGQTIGEVIETGTTTSEGTTQLFLPLILMASTSNTRQSTQTLSTGSHNSVPKAALRKKRTEGADQIAFYYTDITNFNQEGTYSIWLEAQDNAGNITQIGPYELNVTPLLPSQQLYLPLLSSGSSLTAQPDAPDLVLGGDTLITDTLTSPLLLGGNRKGLPLQAATMIQLFNIGTISVTQPFRVDLYFDPTNVPTTTQTWDDLSEYGGYWLVEQPIAPNEAITLTLDTLVEGSNYPMSFEGLTGYVIQLDTNDEVVETHEVSRGLPDNNIVEGSWIAVEEEEEEEGGAKIRK